MNHDLHRTVLLEEAVALLTIQKGSVVVDATGGMGGHSERILSLLEGSGTLIICDRDEVSLAKSRERLGEPSNVRYVCNDFRNIAEIVRAQGLEVVDAVLADLGWNSEQFQNGGKGFSFLADEPLHMTYGNPEEYIFTAHDIVNQWKEETIADVLYAYADEHFARRIAHAIRIAREKKPIDTTGALAALVASVVPKKGRIHPATKTFQALRVAVNTELEALPLLIDGSLSVLRVGGRLGIITFHSIEDRVVKTHLRSTADANISILITKKPIVPTREEVVQNPRSRSAKLRVVEKI